MIKENKVERIALSGGILGALLTNPKRALNNAIKKENANGWVCKEIIPHSTNNYAIIILQLLILVCTLFLWTFGAGYLILFEKDSN